jgi:hypothetical protein
LVLQAVSIPDIGLIIQTKWERVWYPVFVLDFVVHTTLTFLLTEFLARLNTAQGTKRLHNDPMFTANSTVAWLFVILLCSEVYNLLKFDGKRTSYRGAALYDKILKITKSLSYLGFFICFDYLRKPPDPSSVIPTAQPTPAPTFASTANAAAHSNQHWDRDTLDQTTKICLVTSVVASYLHLYYFLMGFDITGPFVLTLFRTVAQDLPHFILFYCLIVVATACALSVLKNDLYTASGGFELLSDVAYKLVQDIVGLDLTHYSVTDLGDYPRHLRWIVNIVLTLYRIVVTILMLNLLIAMISNTYAAYCEYSSTLLLIAKYNIMDAMESEKWPRALQRIRGKYTRIKAQEELNIQTTEAAKVERESPAGYLQAQYLRHGAIVVTKIAPLIAKPIAAVRRMSALCKPAKIVVEALPRADAVHEVPEMGSEPLAVCAETPYGSALSVQRHVHTRYLFELPTAHNAGDNERSRGRDRRADAGAAPESNNGTDVASSRSSKTALFLIDPQVDFYPGGAVSVVASAEVGERIGERLCAITVVCGCVYCFCWFRLARKLYPLYPYPNLTNHSICTVPRNHSEDDRPVRRGSYPRYLRVDGLPLFLPHRPRRQLVQEGGSQ